MLTLARTLVLALMLSTFAAVGQAVPKVKHAALRQLAGSEKFTFVAYGDTRSNPEAHAKVIAEIVGLHPEFVLQSGDLVSDGGNPRQWAQFEQITEPLRAAHIAYYPARGNHDLGAYYPKFVPNTFDSGDKVNRLYYAFTRHRNRFIIVDSMEEYEPGSRQYVWLEGELAKARKTSVNMFVMFHEGPFSVGPHGPTLEAQKYLHPLFVKYHPRAVFCGHDHLYYRTNRDGVPYIVTGGGGAPPYRPENSQVAIPGDVFQKDVDSLGRPLSDAQYDALIYHAIRCEVDGPRVTMTVIRLDGSVIDKFTLGPK
jgi:3',5'-cyclic AMP phosphodiesterase CpdA